MSCKKWYQFHKWANWEIKKRKDILINFIDFKGIKELVVIERKCEKCGYIKREVF